MGTKLSILLFFIFFSCSKSDIINLNQHTEKRLESCVSYDDLLDVNSDRYDLTAYWDKFVADAKCSMISRPDFSLTNSSVNVFFEYDTENKITSGVALESEYWGYAKGTCNDSVVNIGIVWSYWANTTVIEKLALMYHEFGHDVLNLDHGSNPNDIMHPQILGTKESTYNEFIIAKDRFFEKKYDSISYIKCN